MGSLPQGSLDCPPFYWVDSKSQGFLISLEKETEGIVKALSQNMRADSRTNSYPESGFYQVIIFLFSLWFLCFLFNYVGFS